MAHLALVPEPILSNELELLVEASLLEGPPWGGVHLGVLGWAAPIVSDSHHPWRFSRISERERQSKKIHSNIFSLYLNNH